MRLKIAICDDREEDIEMTKRELLKTTGRALEEGCTFQVEVYKNGNDILKNLEIIRDMHILFLDIDMPGVDGLEIAKAIEETEHRVKIMFVTSHSELVFSAIHYRPFRFIRKEFLRKELEAAMPAVIEEIREQSLLGKLLIEKEDAEIRICDIMYLESQGHYVVVNYRNETKEMIRARISDFIDRLEHYGFARTHVGYIVNLRDIYAITSKHVILDNRTQIPVSRKFSEHVKDRHAEYVRRTLHGIS